MRLSHCITAIVLCSIVAILLHPSCSRAATITLPAVKDNTLLRYDPVDPNTALNSNGTGDFFSAGRTSARDEIRRGLIQFDLSSVPANMQLVSGSVHLMLRVIGIPKKDTTPRSFWVVGLSGLAGQWGEGASDADIAVSGSGSGAPAQLGDATWFHTSYDSSIHDQTTFVAGGTGFWNAQGALGAAISSPAAIYGSAAGTSGSTVDFVDFTSPSMQNDLSLWLTDSTKNLGWIIVGDEGVTGGADASSKRDFASRQHANATFQPVLTFDVAAVPEPVTLVLALMGIATTLLVRRQRCRIAQQSE